METEEPKRGALLPVAFVLAFLAVGIIGFFLGFWNYGEEESIPGAEEAEADGCVINYGRAECINGRAVIPFYNAGEKTIKSVHVYLPVSNGTDIFNVIQPLQVMEAKSLTASACSSVSDFNKIRVKWCCEKCYEAEMDSPSEQVNVKTAG